MDKKEETKPIIQTEYSVNIETLGIVLNLSDMGEYILNNFSSDQKNYSLMRFHNAKFAEFKEHEAVQIANKLAAHNLLHFNHYYFGLYYTPFPDFKRLDCPNPLLGINGSGLSDSLARSYIEEFEIALRKFYSDAKLDQHFSENSAIYESATREARAQSDNIPIAELHALLGNDDPNQTIHYHLVPSLTLPIGFNFGPNLEKQNQLDFYFLFGPNKELDPIQDPFTGGTITSYGFNDTGMLADLAMHEYGHSFVRFLQNKDMQLAMDRLESMNTEELRGNMQEIGQSDDWYNVFEEHVVRACEIVLWKKLGQEEKAGKKLRAEQEEGFIYIHDFIECIENYVSRKDEFTSLKAYMPEFFSQLEAKYLK